MGAWCRAGGPWQNLRLQTRGSRWGVCTEGRMASEVLQPGVPNTAPQLRESEKQTQNIAKHRDSACDFQAPRAWPHYKALGLEAAAQPVLPRERGCRQHGLPRHCSPGDPRGCGLMLLVHPQVLRDAEPSPGVLWASPARKTMSSSRTHSEPTGAALEARGAEWSCVWGAQNLGGSRPRGLHVAGRVVWAGGCQRGVPVRCPLRLRSCPRQSWSIACPGTGHGAGGLCSCTSRATAGTPGEMCGESTGVSVASSMPGSALSCSDFASQPREPGISLQLCWRGGAASGTGPAEICPPSLASAGLAMPPASLPRSAPPGPVPGLGQASMGAWPAAKGLYLRQGHSARLPQGKAASPP